MPSLSGEAWTPISIDPAIDFHEPVMNNGEIVCALYIRSEVYLGTEPQLRQIRIAIRFSIDITMAKQPAQIRHQRLCKDIMDNVHRRNFPSLSIISNDVAEFVANQWRCESLMINIGTVNKDPKAIFGMGCQMVMQGGRPSDDSTSYPTMRPSRYMWSIRSLERSCFIGKTPGGQTVMPKMKIDLRLWARAGDQTFPEFTDELESWRRLAQGVCDVVDRVGYTKLENLEELATRIVSFTFTKCPLSRVRVTCRLQLPLSMASFDGSLEVEINRDRDTMEIEYWEGSNDASQDSLEIEIDSPG